MSESRVDIVYFSGCPNAEVARRNARRALILDGRPVRWSEWDLASVTAPPKFRGLPSPTVLVDGVDVSESAEPTDGSFSCRSRGAPSTEAVLRALRRKRAEGPRAESENSMSGGDG